MKSIKAAKLKFWVLALFVSFGFSNCDKDDDVDPQSKANEIVDGVQLTGLTAGMIIEQGEEIEISIEIDKDKIGKVVVLLDEEEVDWFNSPVYSHTISTANETAGEHKIGIDINTIDGEHLVLKEFMFTITGPDAPVAPETVADVDGNVYHTVIIGTQVWLLENLKTKHYRNGDAISTENGNEQWNSLTTGAYCVNGSLDFEKYGALYNFFAVEDTRGICPEGWHVPSREEYKELINYLGGSSEAAAKLKEAGSENWTSELLTTENVADNSSGFTALPGGRRNASGDFGENGYIGYFWTSYGFDNSMNDQRYGYYRSLYLTDKSMPDENNCYGYMGLSVRCIMD